MAMIFHSREALAESESNLLGIEGLGLSQDDAIYYAQAMEGLKKGIPLKKQHVSQDERGYSCHVLGGPVDYKQAYEDTKEIFSKIQEVLSKHTNVLQEWGDLHNYNLNHPYYEEALKHFNGAKEVKKILTECSAATGLQPEQFMKQAFANACLIHSGKKSSHLMVDKKVNQAVDLFVKRSFEVPVLSDNIYYGIQNQSGDEFKTMDDINRGIDKAQETMHFYESKISKDFGGYSKKDLKKIDMAFDVYQMFKHEIEAIKEKSWYKEQRKKDIYSIAKERVALEDGKGDKLKNREKENKNKTDKKKIAEVKNMLDNRLVRR